MKQVSPISHDTALILIAMLAFNDKLRLLAKQTKFGKQQWTELVPFERQDLLAHPNSPYQGYEVLINDYNVEFDLPLVYCAIKSINDSTGERAVIEYLNDDNQEIIGLVVGKGTPFETKAQLGKDYQYLKAQFKALAVFLNQTNAKWVVPMSDITFAVSEN